jgi:MFS family permease
LRQALDTVGAFVGPLAAIGLMLLTANSFIMVFWIAVIPAFLSLALILFGVEEPRRERRPGGTEPRLRWSEARRLSPAYWGVVAIAAVLTLARFSEAFLVLRAQNVGMPIAWAPAVMIVMNVVYALTAYPAGAISDRLDRTKVILMGAALLIAADLALAFAGGTPLLMVGVLLWGLHMGLTQGLLAALVADTAPENLRGVAFGLFNFACGGALLVASVVAGALWDIYGPAATFLAGAGFTAVALLGLAFVSRRRGKERA